MKYDLTKAKYSMTALGTKPKILKKCLDKTEIKPVLENLYSLIRDIHQKMSKYDRSTTGSLLYRATIDAYTHFALSYYYSGMLNEKANEAYKLIVCLEQIKFLLHEIFENNMISDSKEHVKGFRSRAYIIIADLQAQSEK